MLTEEAKRKKCTIIYLKRCPSCKGKGKEPFQMMWNNQVYKGTGMCRKCQGKGMILSNPKGEKIGN